MEAPFPTLTAAQELFEKKKFPEKKTKLIETIEFYLKRNSREFRSSLIYLNDDELTILFHLALVDVNIFLSKIIMMELIRRGNVSAPSEGLIYCHRKEVVVPCMELVLLTIPNPMIPQKFLSESIEGEIADLVWLQLGAGIIPSVDHLIDSPIINTNFLTYSLLFIDPRIQTNEETIRDCYSRAVGSSFSQKKYDKLISISKFYHEMVRPSATR